MPYRLMRSEEIIDRKEFSLLCDWRGLVRAVEVGTDRGDFAREFLSRWRGELLICVDDFEIHADDFFLSPRLPDILAASAALAPFGARAKIVQAKSVDAARNLFKWFGPEFVYLDASHDEESVSQDLDAWWERLSPIGILAGHDYDADHRGVVEAVTKFASARELIVRITDDAPASWYIYRNEPTAAWTRIQGRTFRVPA